MNEQTLDSALHWHSRVRGGDCDWDEFTAWLEADPSHRRAYEEIALLDDRTTGQQTSRTAARQQPPPPAVRRPGWGVLAAAAMVLGVALLVGWRVFVLNGTPARVYQTDVGAKQELSLQDGTRITLAGNSRLKVSGSAGHKLLLQGAAYFDVQHDPGRNLQIQAGEFLVRDIGTRFEILSGQGALRIAVIEGTVSVSSTALGQTLQVEAGQKLTVAGNPAVAEYANMEVADIGSWRAGRLVFSNERLALVALEVSRYAGAEVTVDPAIAERRFSGVFTIGDGSELVAGLEDIMGLTGQKLGGSIRLADGGGRKSGN